MKRHEGFVYLPRAYAAAVKRSTAVLFACLLVVPAFFVAMIFLAKGFSEFFIVMAILTFLADCAFVLLNGLCFASRYCFAVTGATVRIRRGYCCRKFVVLRFSDVKQVCVKRYFRKKRVKGDVQVYEGSGKSALRFLSQADAVYDIRLCCGSGEYDLKYLSQTGAAAVLSYFEDVYDKRGVATNE